MQGKIRICLSEIDDLMEGLGKRPGEYAKNYKRISRTLAPYKTNETMAGKYPLYNVPLASKEYQKLVEFKNEYSRFLDLNFGITLKYSREENERAVAFTPDQVRSCEENEQADYVTIFACDDCYALQQINDLIVLPTRNYTKYKNKYAMWHDNDNDIYMVSELMYQHLSGNGVDAKFFRPVYRDLKKTKIAGYQLTSDHILPAHSMSFDVYYDADYKRCPKCGRLHAISKANSIEYHTPTIDHAVAENMSDVNFSEEFYERYTNRVLVVSPKVYYLIKEKDPKCRFLPLF